MRRLNLCLEYLESQRVILGQTDIARVSSPSLCIHGHPGLCMVGVLRHTWAYAWSVYYVVQHIREVELKAGREQVMDHKTIRKSGAVIR